MFIIKYMRFQFVYFSAYLACVVISPTNLNVRHALKSVYLVASVVRNNESKKKHEFSTCENNSGVHLPSLATSVYL